MNPMNWKNGNIQKILGGYMDNNQVVNLNNYKRVVQNIIWNNWSQISIEGNTSGI